MTVQLFVLLLASLSEGQKEREGSMPGTEEEANPAMLSSFHPGKSLL